MLAENDPSGDERRTLRRGWTTGACAAGAAKAAYTALLTGKFTDPVEVSLPRGQRPSFRLDKVSKSGSSATVGIIKDAGDDPDVTHGALILVTVSQLIGQSGVFFKAGRGVGVVTRKGLPVDVGEPAINPAPREIIISNLTEVAETFGDNLGIEVKIEVGNGIMLAPQTWNPRLGIVGGISILGTTGIVIPYSCSAWIASIFRGIDVARASRARHVAACTGRTSERAISEIYELEKFAILDMGDFAGATLKYLREHPVDLVTIVGGFGKISKLAAGHMDLHSKRSQVDTNFIAQAASDISDNNEACRRIAMSRSAAEALEVADTSNVRIADRIAEIARKVALKQARDKFKIEVIICGRDGQMIGKSGDTNKP